MLSAFCISYVSSLVLPLLCREMVEVLDKGNSVVNHTSLSNYAFLYGVFPVAPGVAIFATQFNMEVEIVRMRWRGLVCGLKGKPELQSADSNILSVRI